MLTALVLTLPALVLPAGGDELPDFAAFGKALVKERLHAANASDVPGEKLREQFCVHVQLGMVNLAYPAWAVGDKQGFENLHALAAAYLELEGRWIDWLGKGDAKCAPLKADVETLKAWVKGWKPAGLAKAESAADKDLFALFGASDAQKTAVQHLVDALCHPDALGLAPRDGAPLSIVFAPTRHDWMELLGYTGLLDATQQTQLWSKDATMWTTFWLGWDFVIALEYPPWDYDKEFKTGLSMNKFEATGMLEHALQQSMLSWLWKCYGDNDALHLQQGMAMNMAIEVVGQCNALEGDGGRGTTGAKTQPYEKFVPGGASQGGVLPPMPAGGLDSIKKDPWHEGLGKDHFAKALRNGQKLAQKQMGKEKPPGLDAEQLKDKDAHFLLVTADQSKKAVVSAPFFGKAAGEKPYPPLEVIAAYKEFFRAYRSSFAWWLQTQGDKAGAEPSAAKWKQLMRALAARAEGKTFEDVVQEVYGLPLSAKNGTSDSLEWRFLDWLGKGK